MADWYLCETCGDLSDAVIELGFCYSLGDQSLKQQSTIIVRRQHERSRSRRTALELLLAEIELRADAEQHLADYARRVVGVEPATHHQYICDELERGILNDEWDDCVICLPPGGAKSTYASPLPAGVVPRPLPRQQRDPRQPHRHAGREVVAPGARHRVIPRAHPRVRALDALQGQHVGQQVEHLQVTVSSSPPASA